jgi:hypothetical protein
LIAPGRWRASAGAADQVVDGGRVVVVVVVGAGVVGGAVGGRVTVGTTMLGGVMVVGGVVDVVVVAGEWLFELLVRATTRMMMPAITRRPITTAAIHRPGPRFCGR